MVRFKIEEYYYVHKREGEKVVDTLYQIVGITPGGDYYIADGVFKTHSEALEHALDINGVKEKGGIT